MKTYSLLILAVLFISACTQQQPRFENNGIKINQFAASRTDVRESQSVIFDLEIENVGSTTASNVVADLINARSVWRGDTSSKSGGTMKPGSLKDNRPGDARTFSWTLTPPDLPEGVVAPLNVKARITYDYSSTQIIRVTAINIDQQEILENQGDIVVNPITIASDDFSPVKVSITRGSVPLVIDPTDPVNDVVYKLEIRNEGNGWPITGDRVGFVTGRISASGRGISLRDCASGTGDLNSAGATLRSDGTAPLVCTLIVDKGIWSTGPQEDSFLITTELSYKYFVESGVTVTVHGIGTGSSGGGGGGYSYQYQTPAGGGSGSLCGLQTDSSTYSKCKPAVDRHNGDCNGNWCVAPGSSSEYCCITSSCRSGFGAGSSITIQIDGAGICR
jgi:hypothetical protein